MCSIFNVQPTANQNGQALESYKLETLN